MTKIDDQRDAGSVEGLCAPAERVGDARFLPYSLEEVEAAERAGYERARAELAAQVDRIAQAIGDPGSIVGKRLGPGWGTGDDGYAAEEESVTRWSTRAVLAVLTASPKTTDLLALHVPATNGATPVGSESSEASE